MGEDDNQGRDREGRNLIYNGKPTGGGKYPFLVSMWMGTSNNVRTFRVVPIIMSFPPSFRCKHPPRVGGFRPVQTANNLLFVQASSSVTHLASLLFGQVSNPNFFTPAMCQGVMITDDMFVTMRGCFLGASPSSLGRVAL